MDSKTTRMDHLLNFSGPIHLIGACGIGMTGIGTILKSAGYTISGSDTNASPNNKYLIPGATYYNHHDTKHIGQAKTIIYSSAIQANNPELVEAKKKGLSILSRGEALAKITEHFKYSIAIAGTHGKTSITCLLTHLFREANYNPSHYIGGVPKNNFPIANLTQSDFFITETDESDASFLLLSPYLAAISNVDNDHLSFYKNTANVQKAFKTFIQGQIKNQRPIICNPSCPNLQKLAPSASKFLSASDISYTPEGLCFNVQKGNMSLGSVQTMLYGDHNIDNILLALEICLHFEIPFNTLQNGLQSFKGVQQRMELISNASNIKIFQDYAHHPVAIQATLKAIKLHFKKKIIVVYQPHRYSRLKTFFEAFSESFELADTLFITPVFSASEAAIPGYNSEALAKKIKEKTKKSVELLDSNYSSILNEYEDGDLIVFFGAGNINDIAKNFSSQLRSKTVNISH